MSGNREALDALMARGLAQPDVVGVGFYDPGGEALAMLGERRRGWLPPVRTRGRDRVDLADGAVGFEAAVVVVPAAVDDHAEDPPLKTAPVVGRVRVVLGTARLLFHFSQHYSDSLFDNLPTILKSRFSTFRQFDWNGHFKRNFII